MASYKILLFADPHRSVDSKIEEEKWFPPICNFLMKIGNPFGLLEKFLSFWDRTTQYAFNRVLIEAERIGPYDLAIGLGDYTPGTNESGLVTPKSRLEFSEFDKILSKYIHCIRKLVWGDHDNGYKFGVNIGSKNGGLTEESVKWASEMLGQPFGVFTIGEGTKFIYVATNLVRNVNGKSSEKLRLLKAEQEIFLAEALNSAREKMVFVLMHDPTALVCESATRKILDSHAGKITAVIHGHLHAEFSAWITRIFSPVYRGLCRKYKMILVPASWGMMGIGGGFKVLNIHEGGLYNIEPYKI